MLAAILITFLVQVLLGLPLFLSLLTSAVVGFFFIDPAMIPRMMPQQFYGGINAFSLMAIPLFILAGNLMNAAGMTDQLMRLARLLVGHLRGGLGHVNVLSSVFFAGVNGSAVADTSALGPLLVPSMQKEGYDKAFAAGLTAGSSLVGPIIPPSIFMILYSSLTNVSVGSLFLAGVVPGLIIAAAFMTMNAWYARRHQLPRSGKAPSLGALARVTLESMPALVAPVIIVMGIVMGVVTPTESGGLIALYVVVCGVLQRRLKLRAVWAAFTETARLTAAIFLIMAASATISWQLSYAQVPAQLTQFFTPYIDSPILVLLMLTGIIFIVGMFMEEVSALMLLTPILMPVALAAGIDPIHLGVIVTLNITIALITPPMGACLHVAAAVSRLEITSLFRTIWPFVVVALAVVFLLIVFPQLTLWLPGVVLMIQPVLPFDAEIALAPIPVLPEPDWNRLGRIPIAQKDEQLVPTSLMPRPLLTYPVYARQGLPGAGNECLVREEVGRRLRLAAQSLPEGLSLVILDGWRPWQVQKQLFETYLDVLRQRHPEETEDVLMERTREFVSLPSVDPASPSPHLTGGSVDVTLCGSDGVWLDMGTPFDATVPASHTAYFEPGQPGAMLEEAGLYRRRRRLLYHVMQKAGFTNLPTEWWHFDYGNQLWAWHAGEDQAFYGPAPMEGSVPLMPLGLSV